MSDENRSCKEVSVVYFDQGTGALHEVRWMKSSFFVFFSCFSLYFHHIWLKKVKHRVYQRSGVNLILSDGDNQGKA